LIELNYKGVYALDLADDKEPGWLDFLDMEVNGATATLTAAKSNNRLALIRLCELGNGPCNDGMSFRSLLLICLDPGARADIISPEGKSILHYVVDAKDRYSVSEDLPKLFNPELRFNLRAVV